MGGVGSGHGGGRLSGFSDEQSRAILAELAKLRAELSPAPDRVLDRRKSSAAIRPRPGDVVRANANDVVVLPHPRSAKGRAPVVVLVEAQPVDVLAESGTVNDQVRVTVTTLGAMEWFSTGTEWWGTAAGGTAGGGGVDGDLAGLSVLGRAPNSTGPMAAITATTSNQKLVTNRTGTAVEWVSDLPAVFTDSVSGSVGTYDLPSTFRSGDTLRLTITGNTTIVGFTIGGAVPAEGTEFNLCLSDQSGGAAPGFTLTIPDAGGGAAQFRTPGQVQGTTPGPSYVMQSEEEGARCAFQQGAWRIIGGTAGQAIDGVIAVAAGNGATRTATLNTAVAGNGLTATTTTLNVGGSTSIIVGANDVQRAALTGNVTAAQNSNATTIANAVITPAMLAVVASNIGVVFTVRVAYTALATGTADDVTVYNANAPFQFRILKTIFLTSTAIGGSTVQVRTATGGGGSALSDTYASDATGEALLSASNVTATPTVAANGSAFVRRSDRGVAGEVVLLCVRV